MILGRCRRLKSGTTGETSGCSWLWTAAAAAVVLWTCYMGCWLTREKWFLVDDAYITYVYARNVADGYGLRYNPTDAAPTEGYSSLLHVVLIAGTDKLGLEPLTATRGLSLLLMVLVPVLAGVAFAHYVGARAELGVVACLCAFAAFPLDMAVHLASGMETVLFASLNMLVLVWAASVACCEGRPGWLRWLSGFALLCLLSIARPEGPLLAAGYVFTILPARWLMNREGKIMRSEIWGLATVGLGWALTFGAYLAWKTHYFGYLLPNPYYVKSSANAIYGTGVAGWPGLRPLVGFLATHWLPVSAGALALSLLVVPRRLLLAYGVLLVPSVVVMLLYSRAAHEVAFNYRYEWPYLLPVLGLAAVALSCLSSRHPRAFGVFLAVLMAWPLATLLPRYGTRRWLGDPIGWASFALPRPDGTMPSAHAAMGADLARTGLGQRATILLSGAGLVPYLSRFFSIDSVGLNNNMLSGRYPLTIDQVWSYIDSLRPDVIYSCSPPATPGISNYHDDPAFRAPAVQVNLHSGVAMDKYWDPEKCRLSTWRAMTCLRDHYVFGACYSLGERYRVLIAYVRRDSPYRRIILAALRKSPWADRVTNLRPAYVNDPRLLGAASTEATRPPGMRP